MSRILYLAEPVDKAPSRTWNIDQVVFHAVRDGWLVYRPRDAWYVHPDAEIGPEIEQVNRAALDQAKALLAVLPSGVPSVGVPREIECATGLGIPVCVRTIARSWSLHDVRVALDDETAIEWLDEVRKTAQDPIAQWIRFRVGYGGQLPSRSYEGDAGFDLYTSEETTIGPGEFRDVPCGVRVALPSGVWGRIVGRSSTLRKRRLLVAEGIIDCGYRGPLYAGVQNLSEESVTVMPGDRIAQMLLHSNVAATYKPLAVGLPEFNSIPGDGRGEAGFGSTGS